VTTSRTQRPRGDTSTARVFDALQALAVKHGSMAAAARIVGCSRETARRILTEDAGASPDLAQRILEAAADMPLAEPAPSDGSTLDRIERAAEERRAAADALRYEPRPATDAHTASASPLDTLAAVVATLLVRHTTDPIAEIDPKRVGCFALRVERHALSLLLQRYGNWNQVALATRGRSVGSSIQRNVERHAYPHEPMSPELARAVHELLNEDTGAWAALLDAFGEDEHAAE
jgi:AraC-like DNA-binding protein